MGFFCDGFFIRIDCQSFAFDDGLPESCAARVGNDDFRLETFGENIGKGGAGAFTTQKFHAGARMARVLVKEHAADLPFLEEAGSWQQAVASAQGNHSEAFASSSQPFPEAKVAQRAKNSPDCFGWMGEQREAAEGFRETEVGNQKQDRPIFLLVDGFFHVI